MAGSALARRLLLDSGVNYLARDTFNRADNASALGRSDSGQIWGTPFSEGGVTPPSFGIASAQGYTSASGDAGGDVWLSQAIGLTDFTLTCDLLYVTSGNLGVLFRGNGGASFAASTGYMARISSSALGLFTMNSGSFTSIASAAPTTTTGQTYRLSIVAAGSSIKALIDGVQLISVTDATYSGQFVGFRDGNTGVVGAGKRWDNLTVRR